MTAKSRRHKLDKKRKSDEHPHPRRSKEADRGEEGTRGRTDLEEGCEIIRNATLRSVSLVPEGQGLAGSFLVDVTPIQQILTRAALRGDKVTIESRVGRKGPYWNVEGLHELHVVDPKDYDLIVGAPQGSKLYLNDYEKQVLEDAQRDFDRKRGILREDEEAVRTSGSSDDEASS